VWLEKNKGESLEKFCYQRKKHYSEAGQYVAEEERYIRKEGEGEM
jgi:hypothetical protein